MGKPVGSYDVANSIGRLGRGQLGIGAAPLLFICDGQLSPGERIVRLGNQRIMQSLFSGFDIACFVTRIQ